MSEAIPLRLIDDGGPDGEAAPAEPKVFVRQFSTPSGAPWDQTRAAGLEARLGAPLPVVELFYQIQRLDRWAPGQAARFAAFYARRAHVGELLEATVEVDGRPRLVRFVSAGRQARAARSALALALGLGLVSAVSLAAVTVAITTRGDLADRLQSLEPSLDSRLRAGKVIDRHRREERALDQAGVSGRALSDYLNDLAWASAAKTSDARIGAVHWDHGLLAVEARGDAAPFAAGSRQVTKVEKPIRPGLWLWGVSPDSGAARRGGDTP